MKEAFIRVDTLDKFKKAICDCYISDWHFDYPNGGIKNGFYGNAEKDFAYFKKLYHGNSKLLLNVFYNEWTRRYEMQVTTAATIRSYPQYKNKKLPIYDNEQLDYEKCVEIFGKAN